MCTVDPTHNTSVPGTERQRKAPSTADEIPLVTGYAKTNLRHVPTQRPNSTPTTQRFTRPRTNPVPRLGLRTKPAPNAAGGLHAAGTAHSAHTSCRHATERHPSHSDATTSARWWGKRDRMWRLAAAAIALAAQQHQSPTTDHPHDRSTATDLFVFVSLSFFMVFVNVSFVVLRTLVPILPIDSAGAQPGEVVEVEPFLGLV